MSTEFEVDPANLPDHSRFAGRGTAGVSQPVTIGKNGVKHIRLMPNGETKEILAIGLACSECFSGPQLAKVLKPGLEYEQKVMNDLLNGNHAGPLAIHTSSGVPMAMSGFIDALKDHLPWENQEELDWCVSFQLEGASAVWAAIDMCLQEVMLESGDVHRKMVAVGNTSYHGPPSTSFGSKSPLWNKSYQIKYPTPIAGEPIDEERLLMQYQAFLDKHGDEIGVLLIEPQWGSSQAALPWPKELLKKYVTMAQERGIRVIADEIMCGLGRHGQGTLFISKAWDLNPDAITFGKAVAAGAYPLSGAIVKRGRSVLNKNGRSVMQSHTFAGSHQRALMTATEVLRELPKWIPSVSKLGEEMHHIFKYIEKISKGMLVGHGQGLMWGSLLTKKGQNADECYRHDTFMCLKKHCEEVGVVPYYVPAGGLMVTPVVDVDVGTIYEIGEKLVVAVQRTMEERQWHSLPAISSYSSLKDDFLYAMEINGKNAKCVPALHATRSCTTCTSFVCHKRRMRFIDINAN